MALKWRSIQKPNPAWAQRYNAAFGRAMAFLDASHARAQAAEDAKARRRRVWVFSIAVVFFAMLTGILTWGREELARADEMSRQAQYARDVLQALKSIGELHRVREAAGDALRLCAPSPENASTAPGFRRALLDKLCEPGSNLINDDVRLIGIYEHVVEGRWRDASEGISQLSAGLAAADGNQLLAELAAMRSLADRSQRSFLLELRDQQGVAPTPSEAHQARLASLAHPVHRRIAEVLTKPSGELTQEEKLLLDAYKRAEAARSASGSAVDRELGRAIVEELRRQPHGHAYAELALVALSPESQVIEGFEAGMNFLRENNEYVWSIGVLMIWPAWRLRRFSQHRQGKPIRSRPNSMRRAVAAVVDIAIATGIRALAGYFVYAAVGIGGSLLQSPDLVDMADLAEFPSGLLAFIAYLLCRDAIRLRFRRSIGKALFDLRPLVTNAADPGAMTVWASMKRNAILPAIVLLSLPLTPQFIEDIPEWVADILGWVLFAAIIFLLVDFARSWFKDGETFVDKWSKTRIIDADSAEALAIRP